MEVLSLAAWGLGELALVCLLYRGWQQRLLRRYPYFYFYIMCVTGSQVVRAVLRVEFPTLFQPGWWLLEFVTAVSGFGVTWEIYAHMMGPYRGARRMASSVMQLLLLLLLLKATLVGVSNVHDLIPTTLELERNLRMVQALLLVVMLALILHYRLPIGRNIRLMLFGYGIYLGAQVATLDVLVRLGKSFYRGWSVLSGVEYCLTLLIWCAGMWSLFPNPQPDFVLESDYQRISQQTVRAFDRVRNHLIQSWRA